jgi:hypothetical protein
MDILFGTHDRAGHPAPAEYVNAFADLERRAAAGEITLAQARREVHALRQRYTGGWPVALCGSRQRH